MQNSILQKKMTKNTPSIFELRGPYLKSHIIIIIINYKCTLFLITIDEMWEQIFTKYLDDFTKDNKESIKFKKLNNDISRIDYCLSKNLPSEDDFKFLNRKYSINKSNKNQEISKKFRLEGNDYFKKKYDQIAFDKYTLSIIYAPIDSDEIILALSNRSAVFFELKLYEYCLDDLNEIKILNNGYYLESNKLKLLFREACCWYYLNNIDKYNCIFNYFKSLEEPLDEYHRKLNKIINQNIDLVISTENNDNIDALKIDQPNPLYPSMINLIDIKMTKEQGRFCVVKPDRDIQAGEILFIEKPYCAILLPEFADCYCDHCFKLIANDTNFLYLNIYTCDYCTNALFCSKQCKIVSLAASHKYECKNIKNILQDLGISHLAYKIIASTNIDNLRRHAAISLNDDNEQEIIETYTRSLKIESNFTTNGYSSVFYLISNSNQAHINDSFSYSLTAILLANYFVNCNKSLNKSDIRIIGSLILRHIKQIICNAHAITQILSKDDKYKETSDSNQIKYATAIYPCVSLMNHSCDPNVICSFKANSNEIVIKATRLIPKNNQVLNCYGPHYLKMPRLMRIQSLEQQYHFKCNCHYCTRKDFSYAFKCLKCESIKLNYEINDLSLNVTCNNCKETSNFADYAKYLNQIKILGDNLDNLQTASNVYENFLCVKSNEIKILDEYANKNRNAIDFFYYVTYCQLLDLIARSKCELRLFKEASQYVSRSIQILKIVYHNSNIEVSIELFKLSEILCNCGQFKEALDKINEAIEIAKLVYVNDDKLLNKYYELRANIIDILS
jgi:SET and MYND domain-containing protein 4